MAKLRVGVIGLGWGSWHTERYLEIPEVEVVALADPDAARLKDRGKRFGIDNLYESPEGMLEKERPDVVSVAVPNKFHKELTLKALDLGCHVLCEKPMAMNGREAREMVAAAEKAGRRIALNHSFRFDGCSWALKQRVDAGDVGDIYYGRTAWLRRRGMPGFGGWFGKKELSGGGPLIDLGVHRLDLALWYMGFPKPTWVMGATFNPIASRIARAQGKTFDVEDLAVATVRFENGAVLELGASWAGNIEVDQLMETRMLGTKAGIVQKNIDEAYTFQAVVISEREGSIYREVLVPPYPGPRSSMRHFVESILADKPHTSTGEEGVIVMDILDALYASAEKGEPVRVGG
jgi:predicted dehydrogenase